MLRYLCSTATQMREVASSKTLGGVVGAKRLTISNGQSFLGGFKPRPSAPHSTSLSTEYAGEECLLPQLQLTKK